jgi:hypothetical protein
MCCFDILRIPGLPGFLLGKEDIGKGFKPP